MKPCLLHLLAAGIGTPRRFAAVRRFGRDRSEADMPRASEAGRSDGKRPEAVIGRTKIPHRSESTQCAFRDGDGPSRLSLCFRGTSISRRKFRAPLRDAKCQELPLAPRRLKL